MIAHYDALRGLTIRIVVLTLATQCSPAALSAYFSHYGRYNIATGGEHAFHKKLSEVNRSIPSA